MTSVEHVQIDREEVWNYFNTRLDTIVCAPESETDRNDASEALALLQTAQIGESDPIHILTHINQIAQDQRRPLLSYLAAISALGVVCESSARVDPSELESLHTLFHVRDDFSALQ